MGRRARVVKLDECDGFCVWLMDTNNMFTIRLFFFFFIFYSALEY